MKKNIAHQLNMAALSTPLVLEWVEIEETFTAEELWLTPYADVMALVAGALYTVLMPAQRAVEHKQQFKDAYKRGGWLEVKKYHRSVIDKIKAL